MNDELVKLQGMWERITEESTTFKGTFPIEIVNDSVVLGYKFYFMKPVSNLIIVRRLSTILGRKIIIDTQLVHWFNDKEKLEYDNKQIELKRFEQEEQIRVAKVNYDKKVVVSRIPLRSIESSTFEKLDTSMLKDGEIIIKRARDFINDKDKTCNSFTISGSTGLGKTHLALAMGIESLKDKDVIYWQTGELLDCLRAKQFDNTYFEYMEQVKSVSLLILDDYGDYKDSDFAIEKMDIIINHRYQYGGDTVVTTNKDLIELTRFNQRITSRLLQGDYVSLRGSDYRIKIAQKNKDRATKNG